MLCVCNIVCVCTGVKGGHTVDWRTYYLGSFFEGEIGCITANSVSRYNRNTQHPDGNHGITLVSNFFNHSAQMFSIPMILSIVHLNRECVISPICWQSYLIGVFALFSAQGVQLSLMFCVFFFPTVTPASHCAHCMFKEMSRGKYRCWVRSGKYARNHVIHIKLYSEKVRKQVDLTA